MNDVAAISTRSRHSIMGRLDAAPPGAVSSAPAAVRPPPLGDSPYARFRELLEANRTIVRDTTSDRWPDDVMDLLRAEGCRNLLFAPDTEAGRRLSNSGAPRDGLPALIPYDQDIEAMKPALVSDIDASLTESRSAIGSTGSVVLWPSREEPRLMSLLPPLHIVLVRASALVNTLDELVARQHWSDGMPTNVVLVSGPSKTADIAQLLAFGVHGPKKFAVMVIQDR